jgi:hypothetical protein
MLPRPLHFVCQLHGLGLGSHFYGLATRRLSGPARDVYLDDLTAFGNRGLGNPPFESLTQCVRFSLLPGCLRAGFGLPQDVLQ